MPEYINREAAIEAMGSLLRQHFLCVPDSPTQAAATAGYMDGVKDADIRLRSIPAADVVEVRHGRWMWDGGEDMHYFCSSCHHKAYGCTTEILDCKYRYCPSCGAKMDGGQDDV